MTIIYEERSSDSPYIDTVTRGWTLSAGSTIRPAENCWHMVFVRESGYGHPLIAGPWTTAGHVSWKEGAEILWIRFKLGAFMPHLPAKDILDSETVLPHASTKSFWLKGSTWQFPDYDNVETFVNRLVRQNVLELDPVVGEVLQGHMQEMPPRTVRHHFLQTAGVSLNHIRQTHRAQQAAALLEQGISILDTVYQVGYFDQSHLTRSLKHFIGQTPKQWIRNPPTDSIRLTMPE